MRFRVDPAEVGYAGTMTRLLTLALMLLTFGLVACGDDDDGGGGGGGGGDAPSKAEFAKQADKICNETEKEFESIGEGAESPDEVANAIDKVIDESQNAADDLVALDRPEGADGETATKFVETFKKELNEKLVPALQDVKKALEANDAQAVQEASGSFRTSRRPSRTSTRATSARRPARVETDSIVRP
jgi:hypothetical protein